MLGRVLYGSGACHHPDAPASHNRARDLSNRYQHGCQHRCPRTAYGTKSRVRVFHPGCCYLLSCLYIPYALIYGGMEG